MLDRLWRRTTTTTTITKMRYASEICNVKYAKIVFYKASEWCTVEKESNKKKLVFIFILCNLFGVRLFKDVSIFVRWKERMNIHTHTHTKLSTQCNKIFMMWNIEIPALKHNELVHWNAEILHLKLKWELSIIWTNTVRIKKKKKKKRTKKTLQETQFRSNIQRTIFFVRYLAQIQITMQLSICHIDDNTTTFHWNWSEFTN